MLRHERSVEHGRAPERLDRSPVGEVGVSSKSVPRMEHGGSRIDTWNSWGSCSGRKALELGEVLSENRIGIVGGRESCELDGSEIDVPGYKWFGNNGEGG